MSVSPQPSGSWHLVTDYRHVILIWGGGVYNPTWTLRSAGPREAVC